MAYDWIDVNERLPEAHPFKDDNGKVYNWSETVMVKINSSYDYSLYDYDINEWTTEKRYGGKPRFWRPIKR